MLYNTSGMLYYTKKGFFATFYAFIYTFWIIDNEQWLGGLSLLFILLYQMITHLWSRIRSVRLKTN